MSTQTKSSSRPWLVFIGCCVLSLVGFGLIVNTPGLYFTVLGETLNVSRTQIALASSIMAIAGAVTMLFAGKVMKMLDSRILISVCIAGVAALFLAQSFFNAVWQFYISFARWAFSTSSRFPWPPACCSPTGSKASSAW